MVLWLCSIKGYPVKGYPVKGYPVKDFPAQELYPQNPLRKEVIQPQVPLRLPCYDFTPVADPTVAGCLQS